MVGSGWYRRTWVRLAWLAALAIPGLPTAHAQPLRTAVAVFPLEPRSFLDPPMADRLTGELVTAVQQGQSFDRVVGPADINSRLSSRQQVELVRLANGGSWAFDQKVLRKLDVTHVLVGNVTKAGVETRLSLTLVDLRNAGRLKVASRQVCAMDELTRAIPTVAAEMASLQATGVPEQRAPRISQPQVWLAGVGLLVAGNAGLAAGLTVLLYTAAMVLLPFTVLYVPTPGLSLPMRQLLFPVMGAAGLLLAAVVGLAGLATAAGGAGLLAQQAWWATD